MNRSIKGTPWRVVQTIVRIVEESRVVRRVEESGVARRVKENSVDSVESRSVVGLFLFVSVVSC